MGRAPLERHLSAPPRVTSPDLRSQIRQWLADGKSQGWSPRTIKDRQETMDRSCWWLQNEESYDQEVWKR
jgi:hypothetical protein